MLDAVQDHLDPAWSTALPDWEDRIRDRLSLLPNLPFHDASAEKALAIFRRLQVPDLVGTPTYGDVCEPWVFDLVRAVFGSYDPETRQRFIREFFLLVPKKNGKSAIAAAIIVVAAILNERPLAELILIAPTQTIAKIAFDQARGIVQCDDALRKLFHVKSHRNEITHRLTNATIKVLSADGDVVTGSKATVVLIDETHVLASKAKAPQVFLELRGGLASRPEGFLLQITTQSKVEPMGQFRKELMRARRVRDGELRLPLLPILYELPRELAQAGTWRDEKTWSLVNPNLGVSVSVDYLRDELRAAEEDGPEALALFASQHLNVEIGLGLHSERWNGADYWASRAEPGLDLEALIARSDVVVVGGDMGGADDLASICVMGRDAETRDRLVWSRAWCIGGVLERRKEIAPKLRDLAAAGDLVIDDDPVAHVDGFVAICRQLKAAKKLPRAAAIGLDAWGVSALVDALFEAGFAEDQVQAVGQGYRLNGVIKGTERRLLDGTLRHGGQPLMTWAVGNCKAEAKGNNVLITKERAGAAKIDPVIAMFNAGMLMDLNPEPSGASYLEAEDLVIL